MLANGIVKHHNLVGAVRVLVQLREEERERQRRAVSTAQRVPEARPVERRRAASEVNSGLVDDNLISRAGRSAAIVVRRCRYPETGVDALQMIVDALPVPA